MKKIFVIIQREFLMGASQKAYLISTVIFPLLILAIGLLQIFSVERRSPSPHDKIAIVDRAQALDFSLAENAQDQQYRVVRYEDVNAGLNDLRRGQVAIVYVIPQDYSARGKIETYTLDTARPQETFEGEANFLQTLLRASELKRSQVPDELLTRMASPLEFTPFSVADDGTVLESRSRRERMIAWAAPLSLAMVLSIWIILSSRLMLTAMMEENENRVVEIVLSSVRAEQLVWGKLIALIGLALLQLMAYLFIVSVVRFTSWTFLDLPLLTLALSFVFCVAGYVFYAGLMTAAGMTGWGRFAGFLTLIVWIPILVWDILASDPNGNLARLLSYIPLTSAVTMFLRLNLTTVPLIDIVGSLLILIVSAYVTVIGGAKIFRTTVLLSGKRFRLNEILRLLREA